MKVTTLVAGGALVAVAAAGGWLVSRTTMDGGMGANEGSVAVPRATVPIVRETLRSIEELDATLGYDGDGILTGWLDGTVTALPEAGDILEQGDLVIEVDGNRRTILLHGERPAWRTMTEGIEGSDVRQLEEALVALGFLAADPAADRLYDARTAEAVRSWQKETGSGQDGIVELGEVAFTDGPVRIAALAVRLGEVTRGGGDPIATTTSARRVVTLPLEADRQDIVAEGDAVGIELPDGTLTDGTVEEVGRVARTTERGETVVDLTIALDDPGATGSLDGAPVTVRITRETREEVLAVPVDALLALAEGGYAVEIAEADGTTRLVGVETGLFADGRVEVTGEIGEGMEVVVPR